MAGTRCTVPTAQSASPAYGEEVGEERRGVCGGGSVVLPGGKRVKQRRGKGEEEKKKMRRIKVGEEGQAQPRLPKMPQSLSRSKFAQARSHGRTQ